LLGNSLISIGKETLHGLSLQGVASKIGHALREAIPVQQDRDGIVLNLGHLMGLEVVEEEVVNRMNNETPPKLYCNSKRAPFVTPNKLIDNPVEFDGDIFFTALEDGITPVPASTASTHKCRARIDVYCMQH
jgi:hypothetical protein